MERRGLLEGWLDARRSRQATIGGPGESTVEITLIAVALLSLFLAISMGVVAWRLVEEERRRSDARLAALAAELTGREGPSDRGTETFVPELPMDSGPTDAPERETDGLFSPPVDSTSTGWTRLAAIGGGGRRRALRRGNRVPVVRLR